jgi:hypothetical protein
MDRSRAPGHPFGYGECRSKKIKVMLTAILLLAGLVCFVLFYKAIDFFDKI